jgi:hypothetical protein
MTSCGAGVHDIDVAKFGIGRSAKKYPVRKEIPTPATRSLETRVHHLGVRSLSAGSILAIATKSRS